MGIPPSGGNQGRTQAKDTTRELSTGLLDASQTLRETQEDPPLGRPLPQLSPW